MNQQTETVLAAAVASLITSFATYIVTKRRDDSQIELNQANEWSTINKVASDLRKELKDELDRVLAQVRTLEVERDHYRGLYNEAQLTIDTLRRSGMEA